MPEQAIPLHDLPDIERRNIGQIHPRASLPALIIIYEIDVFCNVIISTVSIFFNNVLL